VVVDFPNITIISQYVLFGYEELSKQ
jgi:hypothetical protein